jgi:predicted TPR repeat methyltransferase
MNIDEQELSVLYYAKSSQDILNLVNSFEAEMQTRNKRLYEGDEAAFVVSNGVNMTKISYDAHAKEYHRERVGELIAHDLLDEFISLVHPPARVLDVGCGAGFDLGYLENKYTMTGIDSSSEMLEIARFENPESELILADIVSYEPPKNTFKGIWARDVLSHVGKNDQDFVFKKLAGAMVEGGIMMVVVREGEGEGVEEQSRAGYVMRRFYHYYSEEELNKRAMDAGLKVKEIRHTQRSHKWLVGIFEKAEE